MEVDIHRLKKHPKTVDEMSVAASLIKSGKYNTEAAIGHLILAYEKESAELKLRPGLPSRPKPVKRDLRYYANHHSVCRKILTLMLGTTQHMTASEIASNVKETVHEVSNWCRLMSNDRVLFKVRDPKESSNGRHSWLYHI
jgi:hypothetical protein